MWEVVGQCDDDKDNGYGTHNDTMTALVSSFEEYFYLKLYLNKNIHLQVVKLLITPPSIGPRTNPPPRIAVSTVL